MNSNPIEIVLCQKTGYFTNNSIYISLKQRIQYFISVLKVEVIGLMIIQGILARYKDWTPFIQLIHHFRESFGIGCVPWFHPKFIGYVENGI